MNRHPLKPKYWKIGKDAAEQIQNYFMLTGDTDKNIADKFQINIKTVKLLTQFALIKYQNERKSKTFTS